MQIADYLHENGGEVTPEIETALAINETELVHKAANYASVIRYFDDYIENGKKEINRIKEFISKAEKAKERLENNIKDAMLLYEVEKIESDFCKISFRKSSSVEITDEALLSDELFDIKKVANKTRIKEAIKAGNTVYGATIKENINLQIK